MSRKIIATRVDPPIPKRMFDWVAHFDDYDGAPDSNHPVGTGKTEQDAVYDLLEQVPDATREAWFADVDGST